MKAKLYQTYLFRDKDPIIDYLRTAKADIKVKNSKLAADSGVSTGTLNNWFGGTTRRPQFATVIAVARALGAAGSRAVDECLKDGGRKKTKS